MQPIRACLGTILHRPLPTRLQHHLPAAVFRQVTQPGPAVFGVVVSVRPRDLSEHRLWHPGEAEMVVLGAENVAVADAVEKEAVPSAVVEDGRLDLVVKDQQGLGNAKRAGVRVGLQGGHQGTERVPRHIEAVFEAQDDGWWRKRRGSSPQFWGTGSKRGKPVGAGLAPALQSCPRPLVCPRPPILPPYPLQLRPPSIGAGGLSGYSRTQRHQQKYSRNYSQV